MMDALEMTQVFYGGRIPESQKQVASIGIAKLMAVVKGDLRKEFPNADTKMLEEGVRSVLNGLRVRGAGAPEIYYEKEGVAIGAFQQGEERMRELLSTQQGLAAQRAGAEERATRRQSDRAVRDTVMDLFNKYHAESARADHAKPALSAWKRLINENLDDILDLGGYAYFLINWKLLWDNDLYDHEDVIHICQTNPRLTDRKGPAFDKAWSKLGT